MRFYNENDINAFINVWNHPGKQDATAMGKNDERVETDSRQIQFEESGRTVSIQKTGKKADPMLQLYHTGGSHV